MFRFSTSNSLRGQAWLAAVLAGVAALAPMPASADGPGVLQIHGFATQHYLRSSHNNFFGTSSTGDGTFDFREIGVNASLQPTPDLLLAGQVLARWAGEADSGDPQLDYGILDYRFLADTGRTLGIQLGRFKNPLGLYNETRDVAFTRPGILLPQSIYFDRTRTLGMSADGVKLYADSRFPAGDLRLALGVGYPQVDDKDVEFAVLGDKQDGRFSAKPSYIGQILYEHDGGRIRLALTGAAVRAEFRPSGGDQFDKGNLDFDVLAFSAQYNAERWTVTSELAMRDVTLDDFGTLPPQLGGGPLLGPAAGTTRGHSGYLQYQYRFTPQWEGLLRYDVLYVDKNDRDGSDFEEQMAELNRERPAHSRFARDAAIGLRWTPTRNWMVSAEYHRIVGTGWITPQDNPDIEDTRKRWELFALQLGFRF